MSPELQEQMGIAWAKMAKREGHRPTPSIAKHVNGKLGPNMLEVLDVLASGPATSAEIIRKSNIKQGSISSALVGLRSKGMVVADGSSNKRVYRLADSRDAP